MVKTIIKSTPNRNGFSELIEFKELFWMLAWRDFKIRYSQTFLGLTWAIIQPAISIAILYLVFGKLIGVETGHVPGLVFTAAGMLPWSYFSFVLQNSSNSLITAQAMVKKIYFPRLIIPVSKAVVGLIDFLIGFIILLFLVLLFDVRISSNIVFFPLFIMLNLIISLGTGVLFSSWGIRFRDIQYVIPFILQLGLYITPTAYPAEFAIAKLPEWGKIIYFLNPLSGIVEGIRWSLFGIGGLTSYHFLGLGFGVLLTFYAFWSFRKIDHKIADLV